MSTIALIILALMTSTCGIAALWLIRWREQQRLTRARASVVLMDRISLQHQLTDILNQWLKPDTLHWQASEIIDANRRLTELNLPVNSKIRKAVQQASEWLENPPLKKHEALPQDDHSAKHLRKAVQQQIELIKQSYQQQQLNKDQAIQLLNEFKLLNLKIVVTVFIARGQAALSLNNHSQAEHHLNKAIKTLKSVKRSNEELNALLLHTEELLRQAKDGAPPPATNRLAEAAEQINEQAEAWKKKHF